MLPAEAVWRMAAKQRASTTIARSWSRQGNAPSWADAIVRPTAKAGRLRCGPGGWAAVVCWEDGVVEEHSGGLAYTTNNVMEMTAALEGLRTLPSGSRACVVTDWRYLHDGMTSWMAGWKRKELEDGFGRPG